MDKDLQTILETQMKFQKAVTENIEVATKNIKALNERVKLAHDRMDLQGKSMDALLDMFKQMQEENKQLKFRIDVLQECKLAKEGT